jgi:hypothetical protein
MKTKERFIMNKRILVAAMALGTLQLIGCSSTKTDLSSGQGIDPGASAITPIAEQRLAVSDFKKNGIKISYTLFGDIDSIEVYGYAPVWGNSMNAARESFRMAELEAKKTLNDFINKENVRSNTSVQMISQNLEHAVDKTNNKFKTNRTDNEVLVSTDDEVVAQAANDLNSRENAAIRNNALKIASRLSTTITVNNSGILGGLYPKESGVIDDGKAVYVIMRWDKKSNAVRPVLRKLMSM